MFKNALGFLKNLVTGAKPKQYFDVLTESRLPNGTVVKTIKSKNGLSDMFSRVVLPGQGSFLESIGINKFKVNIVKTCNNMAMHGNKSYNTIGSVWITGKDGKSKMYTAKQVRELFQTARAAQSIGLKVGL